MQKRIYLPLALLLLIGCKKDEPAPAPKVVGEGPQSKQEDPNPPKPDEPKKEEPKKPPSFNLVPLDLRAYGKFALIDVPKDCAVGQDGKELVITDTKNFGVRILAEVTDLAEEKKVCAMIEKVKLKSFVVDEPDALVAEVEADGKLHFIVRVNPKGYACQICPYNELVATRAEADLIVASARTMRQTAALKEAEQRRTAAWTLLSRSKSVAIDAKDGKLTVRIDASIPGYEDDLKAVLDLPETAELVLVNTDKFTDDHIQSLGELKRLRALRMSGKWVTRKILTALPELTGLEILNIEQTPIDDASMRSVVSLPELRQLSLRGTRVGDNGVKILTELKVLTTLNLGNSNVTSAGLTHFKLFKNLRELDLTDTAVTDANLADLAAVATLQRLNLAMTAVGDKGLEAFNAFPGPLALELYGTDATLEGIAKLKKANDKIAIDTRWLEEPAPKLVVPPIAIDKLPLADPAAMVAKFGGKITRDEQAADKPIAGIDLSNSKVTDADLGHLRASTKLQKLILAGCSEITDAGLPYLARLTALEELNLRGTRIKGDGLIYLKGLNDLLRLYLPTETAFTGRQLAPIVALPDLEVLTLKLPNADCFLQLRALSKVGKLKEINFTDVALSNRLLEHVKNLKHLETLILSRTESLSDRGLGHLKGLENLKSLVIPAFSGTNFGLESLRGLPNLKVLELYGVNITDGGMGAIGGIHSLERVRLDRLNIGDAGVASLRGLSKPIEMSLGSTRVTDKALDAIADHKEIEYIDLSYTRITDAGLAKLQGLEELRALRLDGTTLTGVGVEAIARLPRFGRISLQDCKVDDAGAAVLARASRLRAINLNGNVITNATLAEFKQLRQLEELDLDRCGKLTDAAVPILKSYPVLKRVSLKGASLSAKAIAELRQSGVKVDFEPKP